MVIALALVFAGFNAAVVMWLAAYDRLSELGLIELGRRS